MSSTRQSLQRDNFPMAVILGGGARTQGLVQAVSAGFDSIRLIESKDELVRPSIWMSPQLVLVTDDFPGGVSLKLLEHVKRELNPVAMICLVNDISAELEIELRSIGLVFLGEYREFFDRADLIIRYFLSAKSGLA